MCVCKGQGRFRFAGPIKGSGRLVMMRGYPSGKGCKSSAMNYTGWGSIPFLNGVGVMNMCFHFYLF